MITNRGAPTPPIAFGAEPPAIRRRFDANVVDVDGAVLDRLRGACDDVAVDEAALVEAGRDWWPLAMAWALDGLAPGRPAAVARPRDWSRWKIAWPRRSSP